MGYTIGQVAERVGLPISTIRYYDKEGLLPFVERTSSGQRVFKEKDFEWLSVIECLKAADMSIKEIKQYIDWCMEGDETLEQRLELFRRRKSVIEEQVREMQMHLEKIKYKIWYYETAIEAGTESVHTGNCTEMYREFQEKKR